MIYVIFNEPYLEYEIHSLLREFFPQEDVQLYYASGVLERENENVACQGRDAGELTDEELKSARAVLCVNYGDREAEFIWDENGEKITKKFPVPETKGDEKKTVVKQELYKLLTDHCGEGMPWGTLTGIRPTRIALQLLEAGHDEDFVRKKMREKYLVSEKKTSLATDIAKKEFSIISGFDCENGFSLYVGIPFCPTRCLYCSFTSYPLAEYKDEVDHYLDALEAEMDAVAEKCRDKELHSVYIGGGTPTTLEPGQLARLAEMIKSRFNFFHCREFTVESGRPDSITPEKLAAMRDAGVGRISINPQTMKQETLDLIGRRHTVGQTVESFKMAREAGFSNINMDLIVGLPGENIDDVAHTMDEIVSLSPESVTVHSLAIKRASRLNIEWEHYGRMQMQNSQEHMSLCESRCADMGLFPYYLYRQKGMAGNMENVGYAREGMEGIYNILMMEEKESIIALGAGSVTKFVRPDSTQIVRTENVKDVKNYLGRIDEMIARKIKKMEELGWH